MQDTRDYARWVRLSGEPNRRAFEYIERILRGIGLRTQWIKDEASISFIGPARLRVTSPVREDLPCVTHAFAASTGGVRGELVYVGHGARDDYVQVDVRGKIVLVEGLGRREGPAGRGAAGDRPGLPPRRLRPRDEQFAALGASCAGDGAPPPADPRLSVTRATGARLQWN